MSTTFLAFLSFFFLTNLPGVAAVNDPRPFFFFFSVLTLHFQYDF